MLSRLLSDGECIKHCFHICNVPTQSRFSVMLWHVDLEIHMLQHWLVTHENTPVCVCVYVCVCVCVVVCCVVLVFNIIAGLLNKETRGWIPGGQMLYMHWKAMLISSEYLIMERRLVLSKQNIQDISVDHGKLLHSQNWWKKSHWAALKIYFLFQKLGNFSKYLGLRLLSEFLAPGGSVIKNLPAKQETRGLIPGSGRPPGVENGNPLQYSCLGNPMNRGAWQATVHGFTKNQQDLAKQ